MKKTAFISILISIAILQMIACVNINTNGNIFGKQIKGNGVLKEQDRGKMDFNAIDVRGSVDVIIADIEDAPIKVSGDENLIDSIVVYVKDGVLNAHFKENFGYSSKIGLKVTVPNNGKIDKIKAAGSSDVIVEGYIVADNISISCKGSSDFIGNIKATECELDFSGSSDFKGNVEATICKIKCTGSSDCIITGKADICDVSMSGSSDLKGYNFIVNKLNCHTSGSSDVQITCNEELSVHASGSSDVYYKGSAKVIHKHTSGSSDVIKK